MKRKNIWSSMLESESNGWGQELRLSKDRGYACGWTRVILRKPKDWTFGTLVCTSRSCEMISIRRGCY